MLSQTEENYLKAIYKCMEIDKKVNTNAIAAQMNTSAASVTDMIKRLSEKEYILYEKYRGVTLTEKGDLTAKKLIRKHRLWEVFLVEWLHFTWDEVHELAEQMEHIQSDELINRLETFLNYPKFDPHGDPIPDIEGNFTYRKQLLISELAKDEGGIIVGVNDDASTFLQYLDKVGLTIGTRIVVQDVFEFDQSKSILINEEKELVLSSKICENLFVKPFIKRKNG
jgi:DtxR family transcriptional regulator, Mn-dependent transcriptional regulator